MIDILANRSIPLKLGYVPVVNRSHRLSTLPMGEALQPQFCGTPFLVRKINAILKAYIQNSLVPNITASITQQREHVVAELYALGDPVAKAEHSKVS
ncbi:hypothetical protein MSAN_01995700 [Mycena sanguinolenta]|uniref:Uncharacterized protein n=1 Tax=Mycena sanguinolenta TaxID=230812 RepID=A0A8H6XM44_9AGAR|nr:hypothetical protein MSAN_01995700 [Mycena sanguinolenta]